MKNSNKIKAGIFVLPVIIFILSFTAGGCSDNNTTNTSTTRIYKQVDQVGRPAMFEGKRFLPETGMPIRNRLRRRTVFADCEPDPLTVAT